MDCNYMDTYDPEWRESHWETCPYWVSLDLSVVDWINRWVLLRAKTSNPYPGDHRYMWVRQNNRHPSVFVDLYGGSDSLGAKHIGWIREPKGDDDWAVFQTELDEQALKEFVINNGWGTYTVPSTLLRVYRHAFETFDYLQYRPGYWDDEHEPRWKKNKHLNVETYGPDTTPGGIW